MLQVSTEERISQTEKRALEDAQKKFDLEMAELKERIEAIQKVPRSRSYCDATSGRAGFSI